MKHLIIKDYRRRVLYSLYERRHNLIMSILQNIAFSVKRRSQAYYSIINFPRDSSITRIRNRCTLTTRARGIYSKFGLSRLIFRKLA
jgi:ribosomal protein S14